MGILNVTPDSFSDGSRYVGIDAALERAARIKDEGAAIIDVGGESTRPGAAAVDEAAEIARVVPVIEGIAAASDIAISIDTSKPRRDGGGGGGGGLHRQRCVRAARAGGASLCGRFRSGGLSDAHAG